MAQSQNNCSHALSTISVIKALLEQGAHTPIHSFRYQVSAIHQSIPTRDRTIILIIARGPSRKRAARSQQKESIVFSLCGYYDRGGKLLGGVNHLVVDICWVSRLMLRSPHCLDPLRMFMRRVGVIPVAVFSTYSTAPSTVFLAVSR